MRKITEYKIVSENNTVFLSELVNKNIEEGWEPFGNVFVTEGTLRGLKHQPMVKYREIQPTGLRSPVN